MVQQLGLHASTAGGTGLIPGQGTKIPQAAWHGQKNEKQKQTNQKTQYGTGSKKQTHRSMEQNRELRDNPTLTCSVNLRQRRQEYTTGKTTSLINCVGKTGPLHVKE